MLRLGSSLGGAYRSLLIRGRRPARGRQLGRSVMVFAPHPDDEVLGCGGTIAAHARAGVAVDVVFMTDGRSSHRGRIDGGWLAAMRQREAYAACRALGVSAERISWLGFEDGRLARAGRAARAAVSTLIAERRPEAILIPLRHEDPPDHRATRTIVLSALRRLRATADIYEYPIWFWHHWPWVPLADPQRPAARLALRRSLRARFGLRVLTDLNYRFPIADLLALKRAALAQHASQMTRLTDDPGWARLEDVSGGRFLACFFGEYELFRAYHIEGAL